MSDTSLDEVDDQISKTSNQRRVARRKKVPSKINLVFEVFRVNKRDRSIETKQTVRFIESTRI